MTWTSVIPKSFNEAVGASIALIVVLIYAWCQLSKIEIDQTLQNLMLIVASFFLGASARTSSVPVTPAPPNSTVTTTVSNTQEPVKDETKP